MRVWLKILLSIRLWFKFQLTHPWGCDTGSGVFQRVKYTISTHTPVRVWLFGNHFCYKRSCKFQLTHPWGCDLLLSIGRSRSGRFQLTHPWGCDNFLWFVCCWVWNFNSHTREGVTYGIVERGYKVGNFNSHTRDGVTVYLECVWLWSKYFNSHTREGVTV